MRLGFNSSGLDAMARQVSLTFITQDGSEVTNTTKTIIDGATAYLIQVQVRNLLVKHIQNQGHIIYPSDYIIIKQDTLYIVGLNHTKFHALEQNTVCVRLAGHDMK